jgi:hypothetical protein
MTQPATAPQPPVTPPAPAGVTPPVTPPVQPPAAAPGDATPPAGGDDPPPPAKEPSWLKQRLDRERQTALKSLGFDSVEDANKALAKAKELEAAAEATRVANLSELEREKDARKKAETDLATEKATRERFERQNKLSAACAQLGVKNTGYA